MMLSLITLTVLEACGPKSGEVSPLASKAELAPAAVVFERYLRESAGGDLSRMESIQSSRTTLRMEIPAMGLTATSEMWWQAPNKMLVLTHMEGLGDIVQGYDGEQGWMSDPTTGARLLEGEELDQARFQADPFGDLHFQERYSTLETVRQTELAGESVWEVKAVPRDMDVEIHYFFSTETGLLVGSEQEVASPLGRIKATTTFSDFREEDGLLSPYRMEQKVLGMNQVMIVEAVEYNVAEVPPIQVPPELLAP